MTEGNLQEELSQQSGSSQSTIRLKSRDYSSIVHFTLQTKIDTPPWWCEISKAQVDELQVLCWLQPV